MSAEQLTIHEPSSGELAELFGRSDCPESIRELDGDLRGRILAGYGIMRVWPLSRLFRWMWRKERFPWLGKCFASDGSYSGSGANRVRSRGKERQMFVFDSRLEASLLDDRPCVVLDYSEHDNGWPMSRYRDELRRIGTDQYLSIAYMKLGSKHRKLCWFTLERSQPS